MILTQFFTRGLLLLEIHEVIIKLMHLTVKLQFFLSFDRNKSMRRLVTTEELYSFGIGDHHFTNNY